MAQIRVLLVTTWGEACGIAEHSRYLIDAVKAADPDIEIEPNAALLDPDAESDWAGRVSILHLNYHAALHSRWVPWQIQRWRSCGIKVLVTYHDSGVPNSEQCKHVVDAADAAVVHEPFDDLPVEKTHYWRMGVPAPATTPYWFGAKDEWQGDSQARVAHYFKAYRQQPVLGTIGFPFGWKCQVETAKVAAEAGWAFLCICPTASDEYLASIRAVNPDCLLMREFLPSEEAIRFLAGCDATAFLYVTHNTGQSGAILQGIAARKPVIAFWTCRQFRALFEGGDVLTPPHWYNDSYRRHSIRWCETFDDVALTLQRLELAPSDPGIVGLAHRESWDNVGRKYADLFRRLVSQ